MSRIETGIHGDKRWYNDNNELHNENGPAVECIGKDLRCIKGKFYESVLIHREWRINGILHRKDGPALEHSNGDKFWYLYGRLHREDGPAVEMANGLKKWYINGKQCRNDGPAIEAANGKKFWIYEDESGNTFPFQSQEEYDRFLRSLKIKEYW